MNALTEAPAARRRWGAIAWPAFVAACVLEIIVFAAFDPADFHAFGAESWQRESVLSIAFLAWPIRSPNYFHVVDRTIWLWNWSPPAKAVNSALFAVLLLVTGWMWLGLAIATALLALKCWSVVRLLRIGLPVPPVAHVG